MKIDKNKILSKVGNITEGTKKLTSDITEKTKDAVTVVKDKVVTKFGEKGVINLGKLVPGVEQ